MKKISFKTARQVMSERLLNDEQMKSLRGGFRCPYCNTEMLTAADSEYHCYGWNDANEQFGRVPIMAQDIWTAVYTYRNRYGAESVICELKPYRA